MSDALRDGRRIRMFNVVDNFSREALAICVATFFPSRDVTAVLDEVIRLCGKPKCIRADNGTEFTSIHFTCWAQDNEIAIDFITPGKPIENCYIENFNGRVRDECLNTHWFKSVAEAQKLLVQWREDYNIIRPHSSLGFVAPVEYVASLLRA